MFGISLIRVLKANHKPHVNQTRDLTSAAFVLNENDCACEPPRFLEYDKQRNFKCTLAESGQHRDYICNLCHSWDRTCSVNCLWILVGHLVNLERPSKEASQIAIWVDRVINGHCRFSCWISSTPYSRDLGLVHVSSQNSPNSIPGGQCSFRLR